MTGEPSGKTETPKANYHHGYLYSTKNGEVQIAKVGTAPTGCQRGSQGPSAQAAIPLLGENPAFRKRDLPIDYPSGRRAISSRCPRRRGGGRARSHKG